MEAKDADVVGDEPVYANGQYAGFCTSGGYGHYIGKSLAMAYLAGEYAKDGCECEVEILGARCPARVCLNPPYDPDGKKMRS